MIDIDTKIPNFRRCVIQNFPFIENTFDALTDYQLISKVVEYLNKVINQQNAVTEQTVFLTEEFNRQTAYLTEEFNRQTAYLTEKFNTLKTYVDNYFENLDVQAEINNKLEAMAEDGTLEEIITAYIQSNVTWTFDTVADMKAATNLVPGSYARTLGYYALNDGGGATYKIRSKESGETETTIALFVGTDLVADLCITNNIIHSKQYGLKGDGTTDETTLLNSFFDTYYNYNIVVDSGLYKVTDKVIIKGTWRKNSGNNGTRSIKFVDASILYTGTAGTCLIIHSMFKNTIDGLRISESSTAGINVKLIGCWFNSFNNWIVPSVILTNDLNDVTGVSPSTNSLEYLNFNNISIYGNLTIKTLNDPQGSFINSINFYNTNISATGYDYAVIFEGNRSKQAINFYNCDLSYPNTAVFNVAVQQNGKGTVNLIGCYLDSNLPIFNNDNKNNLEFNIILSSIPATSNKEIFNIKYSDFVRNTVYGGYMGHGYNLAIANINYSINGDMSSSAETGGGSALMGDTYGDWAKEYTATNLNINGRGRKITLQRSATNPHLTVKGINAPRTGEYSAYIRFKVLSGSFSELSVNFNNVYSGLEFSRIGSDECVFIHSKTNIVQAGTALDFTFYFVGQNLTDLVVEFYEVGVTDGKTYIPNAPLHAMAKIS